MKKRELISTREAALENGDVLQLPASVNYYYVTTMDSLNESVAELLPIVSVKENRVAIDIETTDLDPLVGSIITIQLGTPQNIQYIFDIRRLSDLSPLKELLLEAKCWMVGHNLKFDYKYIKHHLGVSLTHMHDTMLSEQIIRGGDYSGGGYSLDQVLQKRLGKEMTITTGDFKSDQSEKTTSAKKEMQRSFMEIKDGELSAAQLAYAAQDVSAETILELASWQVKQLKILKPNTLHDSTTYRSIRDQELREKYIQMFPAELSLWPTALLEFQFLEVVSDIELSGIGFCSETHKEVLFNVKKDYEEYRKEFLKIMSRSCPQVTLLGSAAINPDSTQQVLEGLKNAGLELDETGADVLQSKLLELTEGSLQYKIVKSLMGYRKTSKLLQAFGEKISSFMHPVTGRIHYTIQQVLDTGRISNAKPNLQQIPREVEWKATGDKELDEKIKKERKGFRECFIAKNGYKFLVYDYSQQELRIAASISMDSMMLQAYKNGKDLHSFSVSLMDRVPYEEVVKRLEAGDKDTKKRRTVAKTMSFGSLYGSSAFNLSKTLHIPMDEAEENLRMFWAAYPDLSDAMERYGKMANKLMYSNTILGRRRYYTNLVDRINWTRCENNPDVIDKKVRDLEMLWLVKDGPITDDNIEYAKSKIINKYKSQISRWAGNHHIQGAAADTTKCAAITMTREFKKKGLDASIVGLVHDEIIVEVKDEVSEECKEIVIRRMKEALSAFCPNVPAEVEGKVGSCWSK